MIRSTEYFKKHNKIEVIKLKAKQKLNYALQKYIPNRYYHTVKATYTREAFTFLSYILASFYGKHLWIKFNIKVKYPTNNQRTNFTTKYCEINNTLNALTRAQQESLKQRNEHLSIPLCNANDFVKLITINSTTTQITFPGGLSKPTKTRNIRSALHMVGIAENTFRWENWQIRNRNRVQTEYVITIVVGPLKK